jgi:hypothetical protein
MSNLPLSITHGSSLAVITDSVGRASSVTPPHYVERRGVVFRWSSAHRGDPYPLLRTVAKVLDLDYRSLVIGCSGLPDSPSGFGSDGMWEGLCIVPAPAKAGQPDAWAVLELDQPTFPDEVRRRIAAAFYD